MLPRVTAAITQFIKPIASAAKRTQIQDRPESGGQQGFQRQSKANLKLVKSPEPSGNPSSQQASTAPAPPRQSPLSVTQTFLQIVALLKQGRGSIARWMGPRTYREVANQQKKTGLFRKGTMVNIKVE